MWPDRSARFDATIGRDHVVAAKAEVLQDGEPVADLTDLGVVVDGSVSVENADERRSGQLTLADADGALQPSDADALLAPTGTEVRLWRGITYPDGSGSELLPIATMRFVVTTAAWPTIDLELHDRAWAIAGAELEDDLTVPAGTNYLAAIMRILTAAWGPGLPTNFPDTDETTATMVLEAGANPWQLARELAANLGMVLWFDPMGVCQMTPEVDPTSVQPAWSFDDSDGGNLALPGMQAVWDGTTPNKIIVVGENTATGATYRGVWADNDPTSPTRSPGRCRRSSRRWRRPNRDRR